MIKYMGERIISFIKQGIPIILLKVIYDNEFTFKVFDGIQLLEVCVLMLE